MVDKRYLKIAFFHNVCAPYRMPLFERISKLSNVELKVFFGRHRSPTRRWKTKMNVSFGYEILEEIKPLSTMLSGPSESSPINPFLLFKLLSSRFDLFIGGEMAEFGTLTTFLTAKMLRKPFILFIERIDLRWPLHTRLESFLNLPLKQKMLVPFYLIRMAFAQIVLKYSNAYVVPGTATKEYLLRRGIAFSKIFTAVNAIDNEVLQQECDKLIRNKSPEKLKRKMGLKGKKVILYVGYLNEKKGVQYLIRAYTRLRKECHDVEMIVVGYGPYKQKLEELSRENNVDVEFVGYRHGSDLINHYLIADVFVLPTLDDVWGFVINEAMVCSCPIITTENCGASRDLVKDDVNGYIVRPCNDFQLYQALKKILCDSKRRRMMREKSREIIKNYCYDKSKEGFESAIAHAAGIDVPNKESATGA